MDKEKIYRCSAGMYDGLYLDFVIADRRGEILALSMFARGGVVRNAGNYLAARSNTQAYESITMVNADDPTDRYHRYHIRSGGYENYSGRVQMGMEWFVSDLALSKDLGTSCFITTRSDFADDLYSMLMSRFDLPLLPEWKEYLSKALESHGLIRKTENVLASGSKNRKITIGTRSYYLEDLMAAELESLDIASLERVIWEGLNRGEIRMPGADRNQRSLTLKSPEDRGGLDTYFKEYGKSILDGVMKVMKPLAPINGTVPWLALKGKTPYSQQGAAINAIAALLESGNRYGLLIEEMGSGKTLQGLAMQEVLSVRRLLRGRFGTGDLSGIDAKTLEDAVREIYLDPDAVNYRVAVVCPSHLTSTWADEMTALLPAPATVRLMTRFSDVLEMAAKGKPKGREIYVFSKDFLKLGYSESPRPTQIKAKIPQAKYCHACLQERGQLVRMRAKGGKVGRTCAVCGGHAGIFRNLNGDHEKKRGLICTECGNVLYQSTREGIKALMPEHFASKNSSNSFCPTCGASLWGAEGGNDGKWYRLGHYTNMRRSTRTTDFVMKGREREFLAANPDIPHGAGDTWKSSYAAGRRMAPAQYLKNHVKVGFFDLCILDEAHLYENSSGQGVAAQIMVRLSKKTIALTGTVSNGTAGSLFQLLWTLDPDKMRAMGYQYSSRYEFVKKYGVIETMATGKEDRYGRVVRTGRSSSAGQEKPGISPLLYVDFLINSSVMLGLGDYSDKLPAFQEIIEAVPVEPEVFEEYRKVLEKIKETGKKERLGMAVLGDYLQFGINYTDKPYGRRPLMHPYRDDVTLVEFPDFSYLIRDGKLLNKERKLVETVNRELAEGRNVFVYCESTGPGDARITERIREVILRNCPVSEKQFAVLEAGRPSAEKRKEWLGKEAKKGVRVFLCNPALVETGLDFIFHDEENGRVYNYPTIIFYQLGYKLATMWQASRRAYRLIQKEICRVYYIVSEDTMQQMTLELMSEKVVSVSAIQGKFSAGALASMAKGVDVRVRLAQAMRDGDMGSLEKASENFASTAESRVSKYAGFPQAPDFWALTGTVQTGQVEGSLLDDFEDAPATEEESKQLSLFEMPEDGETGEDWSGQDQAAGEMVRYLLESWDADFISVFGQLEADAPETTGGYAEGMDPDLLDPASLFLVKGRTGRRRKRKPIAKFDLFQMVSNG